MVTLACDTPGQGTASIHQELAALSLCLAKALGGNVLPALVVLMVPP